MANKKVFTLQMDGVDKAIKNINELNRENEELKNDLKTLTKGTTEYTLAQIALKRNTNDLNKAFKTYDQELEETTDSTKDASKETGSLAGSLESLGGSVAGNVAGAFRGLKKGLQASSLGFKGLKAAIASTGVGLLIIALASLVSYFTKTQQGMDIVSKAGAALGVVVGKVIDLFSDLGEAIIGAVQNPQKAIEDFGKSIQEFLLNRFNDVLKGVKGIGKAFQLLFEGEYKKALEAAGEATLDLVTGLNPVAGLIKDNADAIKDFADEVVDAANKAIGVETELQRLRNEGIDFIVKRATLQRQIEAERLKAEQEGTFSVRERIEALEAAEKAQDAITKKEIEFAARRAKALETQLLLTKSTKEEEEEVEKAKARVIELEGERDRRIKRLTTRIVELRKQEEAAERARIKALEEISKAEDKAEQALIQSRADRNAKALKDQEEQIKKRVELEEASIGDFKAAVDKRAQAEIEAELKRSAILLENAALTANDRIRIEEESEAKINKIKSDSIKSIAEVEASQKEKREEQRSEEIKALEEAGKALFSALSDFADQLFEESIKQKEALLEESQQKLENAETGLEESRANAEELTGQLAEASGQRREFLLQQLEEEEKKQKSLEAIKKQAAKEEIKREKALEKEKKKQAKIEAGITLATSIAKAAQAVATALTIPPPASFVASAATAIAAAAQVATVATQVSKISSLASGGYTGKGVGAPDSTGHVPVGIVHDNEYVVPKNVLQSGEGSRLVGVLENMRTGMKGFAGGGFTTPNFENIAGQISNDPVTQELKAMRVESEMARQTPIVVSAVEVADVNNRVVGIEEGASL